MGKKFTVSGRDGNFEGNGDFFIETIDSYQSPTEIANVVLENKEQLGLGVVIVRGHCTNNVLKAILPTPRS